MKKILKSQAGMSIVQVLIAAAMMGGLALVMGQLGQNQSKMQRKAISDQGLNSFVNTMEKHLLNHAACKHTFGGKSISSNISNPTTIDEIKNAAGLPVYSTTLNPSNDFKITSMSATKPASGTGLKLEVNLEKIVVGKSIGAKTFSKFFDLDAIYVGGVVDECYSQFGSAVVTARDAACKDIDPNATWTLAGGCSITTAWKEDIVTAGMARKKRPLWGDPATGVLKMTQTFHVVTKTNRHNYYCNCYSSGISCPSGYTEVRNWCTKGRRKGRCTGAKSRNGYKECKKGQDPIGYFFVD